MNNKLKRFVSMTAAAVMSAVSMPAVTPVTAADTTSFPYVIEGEDM